MAVDVVLPRLNSYKNYSLWTFCILTGDTYFKQKEEDVE